MAKIVVIVDDDPEMLQSLEEGLERYQDTFTVQTADGGRKALDLLEQHAVSLVVTDLKMPGMDGFELLGQVMESYPDIPVIIMTGFSTPEMKRLAKQGGAVGYIAKPFLMDNLAKKIVMALRRESDGGTLHGVSSGIFLQLIEMEERTCTIRLSEKSEGKKGVLFFREGELLDARFGNLQGVDAAYEIFAWDDVSLSIQNGCPRNQNMIQKDLQAVLLEAMRRKDERSTTETPATPASKTADAEPPPDETPADGATRIRGRIEADLGSRAGLRDVYPDTKWDAAFARLDALTRALGGGRLKVAFIDKGRPPCRVLVPGTPTLVADVDPKCPRDRLIRVLEKL